MRRLAPALCALVLAGCGGGGSDDDRLAPTTPKEDPSPSTAPSPDEDPAAKPAVPVTAAEERVIRGWSDALRLGKVDRAVSFWKPGAIAANGTQPIRLLTRKAIRIWNESLPCGAKLIGVRRDSKYVLATFRLTDRKGFPQGCGVGLGNRARTLFLVEDGKIVQWIRAPGPDEPPAPPSGTPS